MTSRQQIYRVIESLLVTNLTNSLLSFLACWGSVDSLTVASVIVFPIIQLGNRHDEHFQLNHLNTALSVVSKMCKKLFFIYIHLIIHPVLPVAMSTISEKLHNLWRPSQQNSIGENSGSEQGKDEDNKPVLSTETQNRLKLRSRNIIKQTFPV